MDLFADTMLNFPLNDNLNYQNIFSSALTLFVMSTGEAFYDFMNATKREKSVIF